MTGIDLAIVGGYLVVLLLLGFLFSRKASQDAESYFLGGRRLPWWVLGSSGMSSNLDVAGTMTLVAMLYVFGLHGFFVELRGGVVLPIAVFLAFMGKWHRRSQVMTTAEWMELRFGSGWQGRAARATAALTYLIITIGMVVFFLSAAGKFLAAFLPFDERGCQLLMLGVAVVYTMLSGLYGVVWTDVIQAVLIIAAALYIGFLAAERVTPELLAAWPGAEFHRVIPHWHHPGLILAGPDGNILADYRLFGIFLIFWAGKGLLEGLGGSGGSAYMAQRYYAAASERDCLKMSMLWIILFAVRWPLVLGFVILAISQGINPENPEQLLPQLLASDLFPPGFRGLIIAALLAAAMSTFDSTINAGASYVVRDIYQPLRPQAGEKELVRIGWIASLLLVGIGLFLSWRVESILSVWIVIVIHLFPAFLVPFALRWFWSRFNGAGFTAGVTGGFAMALAVHFSNSLGYSWSEASTLGVISGASLFCSVIATFLTSATPDHVLRRFYQQIRPLGWWPGYASSREHAEHRNDVIRLVVAVFWQLSTFLLPMTLMLRLWGQSAGVLVLWLLTASWLLRDLRRTPFAENA